MNQVRNHFFAHPALAGNQDSAFRRRDERGILQTVVSKNDHEAAWEQIERLGLAEFFLHPAINWGQKSNNLRQIASRLNIGLDSFALIDDAAFERAEVAGSLKQVRVYSEQQNQEEREGNAQHWPQHSFIVEVTGYLDPEHFQRRRQMILFFFLGEFVRKANWPGQVCATNRVVVDTSTKVESNLYPRPDIDGAS